MPAIEMAIKDACDRDCNMRMPNMRSRGSTSEWVVRVMRLLGVVRVMGLLGVVELDGARCHLSNEK
jgi:hypothetical protein